MTWSALATPIDRMRKDGEIIAIPIVNTETIYKGDMVRITAAGLATSTTSAPTGSDMFAGVAIETVVNSSGLGLMIRVATTGVFSFKKTSPLQDDVGTLAYVDPTGATNTVVVAAGSGAGSGILVGAVVRLDPTDSTKVRVLIKPMRSIGVIS